MTERIHSATSLGPVSLTVADLARSLDYYQKSIGLKLRRRENGAAFLGTVKEDLLILHEQPGAIPARGATGLYHFALLLPTRQDLGRALKNMIETETPIGGYSDHAVSEALYLRDPDGHGIEIYRDRPREQWEFPGGTLMMTVDPLDMPGVLAAAGEDGESWLGLPEATTMGHVHLHVADITAAEHFYVDVLGFDLMVRYGRAASFVSAGGYHHHLGLNTWAGVGAPPPAANMASLQWYEVRLPDAGSLASVAARLESAGFTCVRSDSLVETHDPSHNHIRLTTV